MSYAILFKFDKTLLQQHYRPTTGLSLVSSPFNIGVTLEHAYEDIESVLMPKGFGIVLNGMCFGGGGVDAVTCVLAATDLSKAFDWFKPSVTYLRMLRIEENSDLMKIFLAKSI